MVNFFRFIVLSIFGGAVLSSCHSDNPDPIINEPLPVETFQAGKAPPEYPASVVFDNVNVITMTTEEDDVVRNNQRVIVENSEIIEIGPQDSIAIPTEALVIDAQGGYLLPGFIDSHVHFEHDGNLEEVALLFTEPAQMSLYLQQGITTTRSYSGTPRNIDWRDKVSSGDWLGTRIISSGPMLNNPLLFEELGIDIEELSDDFLENVSVAVPSDPDAAVQEVNRQVQLGYDYLKIYAGVEEAIYMAAVGEAKSNDWFIAGHIPEVELETVLRNHDEIAHITELVERFEDQDMSWEVYQQWLVDMMVSEQVSVVFNWSTDEVVMALSEGVDVFQNDSYRFIPEPILEQWRTQIGEESSLTELEHERSLALAKSLIDAGVIVLAGSDTSDPGSIPEFIHRELELLVEAGVTPYQALLTTTRFAAEMIEKITGEDTSFGEIRVGHKADLVLLSNNPLTDISNTRERLGVMVNGHWFTQEDLDEMAKEFQKMPVVPLKFQ
ncbi:amidohydrolase family protein [Aliikangiella coralliicola]|uniref:Amidohydrolase family protein n=1 Tax=Aliikangiella coralliicola TaxID=2592383 RepID=A0A545U7G6_9GAMM|nr:amidohydrolase family protein [Aliikangiella coralliicola]TQV85404.1 amidohydrolase family protein [Aliikangiella coralliicola]